MDLDNVLQYPQMDTGNMLAEIQALPDQLNKAWTNVKKQLKNYPTFHEIHHVLIAGMGGSAIAGDLVAATARAHCRVPISVLREYTLPGWINEHTLVIASSHSGDTEETLSVAHQALQKNIPLIRITTGGKLSTLAAANISPCLTFKHAGQPRSAVGFSYGYMLAVLYQHGLIPNPSAEIAASIQSMRQQEETIRPNQPVQKNPAKRLAGQMIGRNLTILGSGVLEPVARRWKGQINELAKTWAGFDSLPEACHNTIAGSELPADQLHTHMVLFLESNQDHPRNRRRSELMRQHLMLQGFATDFLQFSGTTPMETLWDALQYGDYTAYYLALLNNVDPTPIEAIQEFKKELGEYDQI